MDVSDSYNYQQQSQQEQPINNDMQQQQQQQNDMQCEPIENNTITTVTATTTTPITTINAFGEVEMEMPPLTLGCANTTAIPLPAPPTSVTQQQQQQQQQTTPDFDVDSLLLQQFSCLGTTDHEDLINQFRTLLNHETTKDSAKFFLEMSNWNLQAAIGCYLDYFNGQQLPSMKVVLEARPTVGRQAWRIRNEGNESWPSGCYLISPGQDKRVDVPALRSGECCDIIADIPPTHPTMCVWRLCTPYGSYFGDAIIMVGWEEAQLDITERMTHLSTSNQNAGDAAIDTNSNSDCLQVKVIKVVMD